MCAIDGDVFEAKSDQTDLATMLGLLTGVGIPAGSIGVPPLRVLRTFWPQPFNRYVTLLELLEHLRKLTKCTDTVCDHEFLTRGDGRSLLISLRFDGTVFRMVSVVFLLNKFANVTCLDISYYCSSEMP